MRPLLLPLFFCSILFSSVLASHFEEKTREEEKSYTKPPTSQRPDFSHTPEDVIDPWAHFLTLFSIESGVQPPVPLNFMSHNVTFQKGNNLGSIQILDAQTQEEIETFTFPADAEMDHPALFPYFKSFREAVIAKNPEALEARVRFKALLKDLEREAVLPALEGPALSAAEVVENFPAWVDTLEKTYITPYEGDLIPFLKDHREAPTEWFRTVSRGYFTILKPETLTTKQGLILLEAAKKLGHLLSERTADLFAIFSDEAMAEWAPEFQDTEINAATPEKEKEEEDTPDIPFTPEEHYIPLRLNMLNIHHMLMEAYFTVDDMQKSLSISDSDPDSAEDFAYQKRMLEVFQAFLLERTTHGLDSTQALANTFHFNPIFMTTQAGLSDFSELYTEFMGSLLDSLSQQGLTVLRHPYLRANTLDLLRVKVPILRAIAPCLHTTSSWFETTAPAQFQGMTTALESECPENETSEQWAQAREKLMEKLSIRAQHYLERFKYWRPWAEGLAKVLAEREENLSTLEGANEEE